MSYLTRTDFLDKVQIGTIGFGPNDEKITVGDISGDGKDDIICCVVDTKSNKYGAVYLGISDGSKFKVDFHGPPGHFKKPRPS